MLKMRWSLILTLTFILIFLCSFTSAIANVTLTAPPNNAVLFTNPVTISLSTSTSDLTSISNYSLWSNVSGSWAINQSKSIGNYSLTKVVSTTAVSNTRGMRFIVNRNFTGSISVFKSGAANPTVVTLQNDSFTNYTEANFAGNKAELQLVNLTAGKYYHIVVSGLTSIDYNGTSSSAISYDYINFTDAIEGASIVSGIQEGFVNLTFNPNSLDDSFQLNVTNLTLYGVQVCTSDGLCNFSTNRSVSVAVSSINSNSYNLSTYETAKESFSTNFTLTNNYSITNANLIYDGLSYVGSILNSGRDYIVSYNDFDIPLGNKSVSWYWNLNIAGETLNSSSLQQNVSKINFTICGASPQNMYYINETFLDETYLNATFGYISQSTFNYYLGGGSVYKTLTYQNSTQAYNYSFCFSPINRTVYANVTFQYGGIGYGQRSYTKSYTLTNSTTVETNYLLLSSQGISSAIQTVQSIGNPVSGVLITAERQISGNWVLLGSALSDSSGLVTFFVNPNYDMRVTASKQGYATQQVTIRPSQTQYSIVMNPSTGNASYSSNLDGIKWITFPSTGSITGTQNFGMNLTASNGNLLGCRLIFMGANGSALSTTTIAGTPYGCNLSVSFTLPESMRVFGQYYIQTDTSGGYFLIDGDALWYTFETSHSSPWNSLSYLFRDLANSPEFGSTELRNEFSRVIFFYFFLIIGIGLLTFFTEYDRIYPGFFFTLVWAVIAIASKGGFLTLSFGTALTGGATALPHSWQQYTVMIIAGLFTAGFLLNRWARES